MNLKDRIDENGNTDIKVSVVILAHNNLPLTIECYESVLATKPKGMDLEVVILDNGSTDGTAGWLDYISSGEQQEGTLTDYITGFANLGFAGGMNQAVKSATGDIIILLNNDTIVTPGWIAELVTPLILVDELAVTVPASNYAGGIQMIKTDYKGREDMFTFALDNLRKNHNVTEMAGMVSGLCMAFRRDTIDKLTGFHCPPGQLFDERFKVGMWEDNDLCLRIQLLGMKCLVCYGAFIHHEGSATFKKIGDPKDYFDENRDRFHQKWKEEFPGWKEQKLVAMIRVKNGERHIRRCLQGINGWVDEAVILDTGSTDRTLEIMKEFAEDPASTTDIILDADTFANEPLSEHKERQFLLEMAQSRNPTWIIRLDVDEVFESRIVHFLPQLLMPDNPQILCWHFPMKTFWRGTEKYRADGDWGRMGAFAMFRNLPGQKLFDNKHPQGFHCPAVPVFQRDNIGFCGVSILHYGYCEWEEVIRKYEWYSKTDTDKRVDDIGATGDYRHLVDESNLQLITYCPTNGISLNMMMGDEDWGRVSKIVRSLEMVVDEFIITYTGENEPAEEDVLKVMGYPAGTPCPRIEFFHYKWKDNYAAARNFGLEHCSCRWVLHLDPDEEISPKDIGKLVTLVQDENAKAYSFRIINWFSDPNKPGNPEANVQQAVRMFQRLPGLTYSNIVHETLDDAIKHLGLTERDIPVAQVTILHSGYLLSGEKLRTKLEYYARLNKQWIEMAPEDPRPYYNLGIHYLDMDDVDTALDYLEAAREYNNKGDMGLFQVGLALSGLYLRNGLALTVETIGQLPSTHPQKGKMVELAKYLDQRVGKVRHLLKEEEPPPSELPPPAITPLLPFIKEGMDGAEIGVQQGFSSEAILRAGVATLLCIDPWADIESYNECRGWTDFGRGEKDARRRLKPWVEKEGNEVFIYKGTSSEAVKGVSGKVDFAFIDGNHEEEAVYRDIEDWWPKIKKGGFLCGHDYYPSPDQYHRVKEAVDRWAFLNKREVEVYGDCWLIWKK